MSRVCQICGKHPVAGRTIARRGMAKRKGGVGIKTTGVSRRVFRPNIQRVKVMINGAVGRLRVCTRCIKAGKIQKAA
jgi:large subunit ribosomal protein L28